MVIVFAGDLKTFNYLCISWGQREHLFITRLSAYLLVGTRILWMKVSAGCSVMSASVTTQTVASQAPLSMGFPRQEYSSGLPFPPPGDLPDPGIESGSPAS